MTNSISDKAKNLLRNFGWMFFCYIIFFIILGYIQSIFPEFSFNGYQQTELMQLLEEDPFKFLILAVILAPLIEEGIFRTLIKPSANELLFFLSLWLLILAQLIIPQDVYWVLKYIFLILLGIISFLFLREVIPQVWQQKTAYILGNHYKLIWIMTSIIFGWVHVFNYVDGLQIDFQLFLLVLPRIIAGYFFGKVKIENESLLWPIIMHGMNNGTVMFFLLPKVFE